MRAVFSSVTRGFFFLLTILVVIGGSGVLGGSIAHANGGPVVWSDLPGGMVYPDDTSTVKVVSETITFDFVSGLRDARLVPPTWSSRGPDATGWLPLTTARYELENPGTASEDLTVAFMFLTQQQGFEGADLHMAWNDGTGPRDLDITWPERFRVPPTGVGPLEMHWLQPESGVQYRTASVLAEPQLFRAALANVELAGGARGTLEIQYYQAPSGFDRRGKWVGDPAYHYTYLLQPARLWSDFGELTVRVKLPPGTVMASQPSLSQVDATTYEGFYESLPEGDLHISIDPAGFYVHPLCLIGASAAVSILIWGLTIWFARRKGRSWLISIMAVPVAGTVAILLGTSLVLNLYLIIGLYLLFVVLGAVMVLIP